MEYTKGDIGRIFLLKFNNEDIFLEELEKLAKKEQIETAVFVFLGALKEGQLVVGPRKPVIPLKPNRVDFKGGWEVMGMGTVFTNEVGPQIHIHATVGKKQKVLMGCVRKGAKVFLVVEAFVFELKGVKATKTIDSETGLNLLKILM